MKKITILIISVIPFFSNAQKQGNIWYFGIQSGLDFSSGSPVFLTNGQTGTDVPVGSNQEGTSCISDSSGNLLFYTGGLTIWNRNHVPMTNGTGIMGGVSSTQSSLIVPLPGSSNLFYVFTSDEFQSYTNGPQKGYRYSVVDMCLSNSFGDVKATQKNILLLDTSTEKLAACEDAAGTGYWIMGHKMFSNEFHAWHLTLGGITNTVVSSLGTLVGWDFLHSSWIYSPAQGQMKFNSSSTKLALAINSDPPVLDFLDFNATTGVVSNLCHIVIDSAFHKSIYGIEFSPDNSKLYVAVMGGFGGKLLYQYNLTAGGGNCDSIINSRTTLFQSFTNSIMFGMQLAPNGKIYLIDNSTDDLGCINNPNLTGLAASFDSLAITISGSNGYYMLPSFIAGYKYHNKIPNCSATGIEEFAENNNFIIYPNPAINNLSIEVLPKSEIEILNIEGQIIKSMKIIDNYKNIDISSFSTGVYIIKAKTEKGISIKKFIKL